MDNNLFLGPDANARFLLERLRGHHEEGAIGAQTQVMDSILLSSDPESGVTGEFVTRPGMMLALRMEPSGQQQPRWQSMHIPLGPIEIAPGSIFGVVIKSSAPASITTQICLRSGRAEGFVDQHFTKTLVSFAQPSTHLDVLEMKNLPTVPRSAPWRDLILFFRPGRVEIELTDIRIFLV